MSGTVGGVGGCGVLGGYWGVLWRPPCTPSLGLFLSAMQMLANLSNEALFQKVKLADLCPPDEGGTKHYKTTNGGRMCMDGPPAFSLLATEPHLFEVWVLVLEEG